MTPMVYVGGTFDLFHPGHVNLLRRSAQLGRVTVSLNTDEFAERYKRRPVMSLEERKVVVASCRYVEHVMVNDGDEDSRPAILSSRAKYVVHGDEWQGDSLLEQMKLTREWLREHDISLVYLPYTAGVTSSDIRARISIANGSILAGLS